MCKSTELTGLTQLQEDILMMDYSLLTSRQMARALEPFIKCQEHDADVEAWELAALHFATRDMLEDYFEAAREYIDAARDHAAQLTCEELLTQLEQIQWLQPQWGVERA